MLPIIQPSYFQKRYLQLFLIVFNLAAFLFGQWYLYRYEPATCILCDVQRGLFLFLFVIGMIHFFWQHAIPKFMLIFFSISGLTLASRQAYIYFFPVAQYSSCINGLMALLHYFPISSALKMLWLDSHCDQAASFLYLPLWSWSFLGFALNLIICAILLIKLQDTRQ